MRILHRCLATVFISSILSLLSTETGQGAPAAEDSVSDPIKIPPPETAAVVGTSARSAANLKAGFTTPPPEARPRFFWFWLGGSMTKEGIQADLQAMHEIGIGGVLMMNVYPTPPLNITCMGDNWWDLLTYANTEAKRQGILFGTHNCPGWSTSGGPWNTVENSMQKVVFSEQTVQGPGADSLKLARPEVDPKFDYYRDITVLAVKNAKAQSVPVEDIIDLSGQMDEQGLLTWRAPEGVWTVYRFGHTTTGHKNGPPIEGGQGLECDKMSREATKIHFEGYAKKIIERMRPLVGETFHNLELDSYEAGKQDWTPKFREEFQKRRGYDLLPWLPVLADCILGSPDQTARFKWDMEKTISDLYVENHYQYLADLARQEGVRMDYEAYGGPFDPLGAGGAADMPMGEGWTGLGGWSSVKLAVSAAHTHGRPLIGCEALTSTPMHSQWKQTMYSLKAFADQAFSMGINMLVLHCYAQQPWEHVRPGMTMNFWGTQFSRTQTWWDLSRPWFDYISRCQFLLQRGMPVVDICILGIGEPGGIPAGFKTDFCNEETLSRMTVENGDLVLPDGMRYRLLLLPGNRQIPMQSLKEIDRLVKAGASIAGPRPDRIPGLTNYPNEDREIQKIAGTIWGNCDGNSVKEARCGKGYVFWGLPVSEVLAKRGISPDVVFREPRSGEGVLQESLAAGILFNHRSSKDEETYFISNQEDCFREVVASFRAAGKRPTFWFPDTGKVERVPVYEERDGRVSIPLRLPPSASLFVVFQDTAGEDHLTRINPTPGKNAIPATPLQPLRIAKATAISKDKKTFVDLTEQVQALSQSGILRMTPEVFHQITAGLTNVERISVNYLVEDDWHTRYAHPSGTLQIPEGVPLSRDVDYEVATSAEGKTSLTVWKPGTYNLEWASGKSDAINVDTAGASLPLNQDWKVSFKPGLGAPESVRLSELHSLSKHEIPGVKFYSGISSYEKAYSVPAEMTDPTKVTRLDLGQVKSAAEVVLNGRHLGILWKPPFQVDVTGLLRTGENQLQIKVANNWPNRMIGDEQEPDDCTWSHIISWPHGDQPEPVGRSLSVIPDWVINKTPRPSAGRVTFSTWKFFDKDSPLLESGLLGPVKLDTAHRFTLDPSSKSEAHKD